MSQMRLSIAISGKSMATTLSLPNNSKSLKIPNASNRHEVLKIVADGCESINLSSLCRRDLRTWVSARPDIQSGGGDATINNNNNGGGGGGGEGGSWGKSDDSGSNKISGGLLGAFLQGWKAKVEADPQFPFKVLMEEIVGVSSGVVGDMASRPNFGLNELDLVFSTIVVACIVNFTLMYMLAPTGSAVETLPGIFAGCPTSHVFEVGSFNALERMGTFVYKGTLFAAVGFVAGLVGTVISNGLISVRKKMDPNFETPNKAPPTWLNASTWAAHMGLSSNFRYQTLNGIEFLLAKGLPHIAFKSSVIVLRCLNNVLGGVSFVLLARITGAQRVDEPLSPSEDDQVKDLQSDQSS
ncbi:protein RETICULATA-RELATED 3, chloroplastic-like [Cryptomeria japonica]|uniref:protein RETICULATA-RELATED 3, chloroplastic-like n=1 Tax=Cryptomeria japonica TaxID=3369 RepID=UPI0027DA3A8A|nr:protein RETICULATA-RELATED 3, chloroplastic-like [Cryptomeria japonica]